MTGLIKTIENQMKAQEAVLTGVNKGHLNKITDEYEKSLVSFGNYLLSEEREKRLTYEGNLTDETVRSVHHSDLKNWQDQKLTSQH